MEKKNNAKKAMVVRHRSGNYARVVSAHAQESNPVSEGVEIVMYSELYSEHASLLAKKYNRVHSALSKGVYRDYLGLLNSLSAMYPLPNSDEEVDDAVKVNIFYSHYGLYVTTLDELPDDIWESRVLYLPMDEIYVNKFIERIRLLDISKKEEIVSKCIYETDKLFHKMFDEQNKRIPLDSLA